MQITLHLGAHKTASTHLQLTLQQNNARLGAAGICYIPLTRLRKIFTHPFRRACAGVRIQNFRDHTRHLLEALKDEIRAREASSGSQFERLIVSDENIFGSLKLLGESGLLYSERMTSLQLLSEIFRGYEVKVIFAIRNYAEFYPSAFAELVRNGSTLETFASFMARMKVSENSWTEICNSISSIFGEHRTRVFCQECYAEHMDDIIREVIGRPIDLIVNANKVVRKSLPDRGVSAVIALADIFSRQERKRMANYLATNFVFDSPVKKIALANGQLRGSLDLKYREDILNLSRYLLVPVREALRGVAS